MPSVLATNLVADESQINQLIRAATSRHEAKNVKISIIDHKHARRVITHVFALAQKMLVLSDDELQEILTTMYINDRRDKRFNEVGYFNHANTLIQKRTLELQLGDRIGIEN